MPFFIPLTCVTLSQFYSITSLVLFTKHNRLWNEKKNIFVHMTDSAYRIISKEVENCVFRHYRHRTLVLLKYVDRRIFVRDIAFLAAGLRFVIICRFIRLNKILRKICDPVK